MIINYASFSSNVETSSSLALMSSSPKMTSSVESCSLHAMYSSPLPPSSALMMTSSSSSLIRISPSKSSQVTLKSTASSRSPSSRNDTDKGSRLQLFHEYSCQSSLQCWWCNYQREPYTSLMFIIPLTNPGILLVIIVI